MQILMGYLYHFLIELIFQEKSYPTILLKNRCEYHANQLKYTEQARNSIMTRIEEYWKGSG